MHGPIGIYMYVTTGVSSHSFKISILAIVFRHDVDRTDYFKHTALDYIDIEPCKLLVIIFEHKWHLVIYVVIGIPPLINTYYNQSVH